MTKIKYILFTSGLILFCLNLNAQFLVSMHAKYDDNFSEWLLYTEEEYEILLETKWKFQGDWTVWQYEYEGEYGEIRQKWKNDPNWWELRVGDETYTIKTIWRNDLDQWRIQGEGIKISIESKYSNYKGQWSTSERKLGEFEMFFEYDQDPRDWIIEDYLGEKVSIHAKVGLAFVTMFNSIPKN